MVVFPNCKINIGLNILTKRTDGYHDLQTIFYPIGIRDVLEVIEHPGTQDVEFSCSGINVPGRPENNLCIKANQLLKKDFPNLPGIKIHLHKNIPMGAGLGGGSADAAFVLTLLNKKFSLNISASDLQRYALMLGSDCPFFILNQPSFATGRGELLEPVTLDLSAYKIFVINPGIHISTSLAFSQVSPGKNDVDLRTVISSPITNWRNVLVNDFEHAVFETYPEMATIKAELYNKGALYASMSGSGSTLYGIFPDGFDTAVNFPGHYFQRWI